MGITSYAVTTAALTGSHYIPAGQQGTNPYLISGYSYTNPNITVTTTTNHNFQVGHRVTVTGINVAGTPTPNTTGIIITAVTANTFTFNFGATTPGTYTNGGVAYQETSGNPQGAKYVNGTYILWTQTSGSYFYSFDSINWLQGQLPGVSLITAVEGDGSTYFFGTEANGIYSSTTLLSNSWTQRTTFGTFTVNDIKWCTGSVNRLVAVGSNTTNSPDGTGPRIETAPIGGVTWTNQTISGTSSSLGLKSIAFDGVSTVVAMATAGQPSVSTSGGGSWIGYVNTATTRSDGNGTNFAKNNNPTTVFWNVQASKWVGFALVSRGLNGGSSTAGAPSSVWTKEVTNVGYSSVFYSSADRTYGIPMALNFVTYDQVLGRFYTYTAITGDFTVYSYSAVPVSLNTYQEYYPLVSVSTANNALNNAFNSASATITTNPNIVFGYGNGKWFGLSFVSSNTNAQSYVISVYQ